jgi:hypothetical protein
MGAFDLNDEMPLTAFTVEINGENVYSMAGHFNIFGPTPVYVYPHKHSSPAVQIRATGTGAGICSGSSRKKGLPNHCTTSTHHVYTMSHVRSHMCVYVYIYIYEVMTDILGVLKI